MRVDTHTVRPIPEGQAVYTTCQHRDENGPCPNRPTVMEKIRWFQAGTHYGPAFYYYCHTHHPEWTR